jgi:hypothetical protein
MLKKLWLLSLFDASVRFKALASTKRVAKLMIAALIFIAPSCAKTIKESPVVYISNASLKPIKNINCYWAQKNVLRLPTLNPGETRSQSFFIEDSADFFGLVKVSWINGDGNQISREFFFRKVNLPSIEDHTTYNYVQLYFDQNYVEVTTSDSPDMSGKTKKMDNLLVQFKELYARGHNGENSYLIEVKSQKETLMDPSSALGYYHTE